MIIAAPYANVKTKDRISPNVNIRTSGNKWSKLIFLQDVVTVRRKYVRLS